MCSDRTHYFSMVKVNLTERLLAHISICLGLSEKSLGTHERMAFHKLINDDVIIISIATYLLVLSIYPHLYRQLDKKDNIEYVWPNQTLLKVVMPVFYCSQVKPLVLTGGGDANKTIQYSCRTLQFGDAKLEQNLIFDKQNATFHFSHAILKKYVWYSTCHSTLWA